MYSSERTISKYQLHENIIFAFSVLTYNSLKLKNEVTLTSLINIFTWYKKRKKESQNGQKIKNFKKKGCAIHFYSNSKLRKILPRLCQRNRTIFHDVALLHSIAAKTIFNSRYYTKCYVFIFFPLPLKLVVLYRNFYLLGNHVMIYITLF